VERFVASEAIGHPAINHCPDAIRQTFISEHLVIEPLLTASLLIPHAFHVLAVLPEQM